MTDDHGPDLRVRFDLRHLTFLVVGYIMLRFLFRWLLRVRVRQARGVEIPCCLFVANHRSFIDPPLIATFLRRPTSFFARASLWRIPIIRQLLQVSGGLPIDRNRPQMEIMRRTVKWLREGRRIVIFPEGTRTRSGRLGRLREGPALFARRADAHVVPVYVARTDEAWPRTSLLPFPGATRIEIRYGRPIKVPAHLDPRLRDRWLTEVIRRWMERQEADFIRTR